MLITRTTAFQQPRATSPQRSQPPADDPALTEKFEKNYAEMNRLGNHTLVASVAGVGLAGGHFLALAKGSRLGAVACMIGSVGSLTYGVYSAMQAAQIKQDERNWK